MAQLHYCDPKETGGKTEIHDILAVACEYENAQSNEKTPTEKCWNKVETHSIYMLRVRNYDFSCRTLVALRW